VLVTATGGEEGASRVRLRPGESIRQRRHEELERACELLGVQRLVALGYRDSGAHGGPYVPGSLGAAAPHEVAARVAAVVEQEAAGTLVHYDPQGIYGHIDHVRVLELDFKDLPNCELAFFGLAKDAIGSGLGRALMNIAITKAWEKPINRLWVHTCHFDHPNALGFYKRSGFEPYSLMVEIHDDPRLAGKLPRHASPHVALIDPK